MRWMRAGSEVWMRAGSKVRCVMAVFGWGGCTLIALCWSRPSPLLGGRPGFSPGDPPPSDWLTWSWKGRHAGVSGSNTSRRRIVQHFGLQMGTPRCRCHLVAHLSVWIQNVSLTSSEETVRSTVAWRTPGWKRHEHLWNIQQLQHNFLTSYTSLPIYDVQFAKCKNTPTNWFISFQTSRCIQGKISCSVRKHCIGAIPDVCVCTKSE